MRKEKLEYLIQQVEDWANQRSLINREYTDKQYLKFIEETGELARALLKHDVPNVEDGFGDTLVTIIILAKQLDVKLSTNLKSIPFEKPLSFYSFLRLISAEYLSTEIIRTLDNVANSYGYDVVNCLEIAYNEISNRKGQTIDGSFVKD